MGSMCSNEPKTLEINQSIKDKLQIKESDPKKEQTRNKEVTKNSFKVLKQTNTEYEGMNSLSCQYAEYQLGDLIGQGKIGKVYSTLSLETGKLVVTKKVDISKFEKGKSASLIDDITKSTIYSHENLNKYISCYVSSDDENSKLTINF